MPITGTVQRIDKESNLVVDTPSERATTMRDAYNYYLELNASRYYFKDKKLRENTKPGDRFSLVANGQNVILAWKNHTRQLSSSYSVLHAFFHENTIVAAGVFIFFWVAFAVTHNETYVHKLFYYGLPVVGLVFLWGLWAGRKKLQAHRALRDV